MSYAGSEVCCGGVYRPTRYTRYENLAHCKFRPTPRSFGHATAAPRRLAIPRLHVIAILTWGITQSYWSCEPEAKQRPLRVQVSDATRDWIGAGEWRDRTLRKGQSVLVSTGESLLTSSTHSILAARLERLKKPRPSHNARTST